ncbi:hypothetical protein Rumeso_04188 [Rubellimicrobium mesophilum DSM 19309]|uniref:Uncharacterized protein n=2 Tax=Rubellimicrobium TaxID=295418 RepID=A0A017HIA8_9RHOB|nr:hypothetical protein Rumeso_04188 [Rubellimicrobium mesophilum DSM 19309]
MLQPAKGIPFEVVIRSLCGVGVEKFDVTQPDNKEALDKIVDALRKTCRTVQAKPIERPRPNEVGNDMEPFVINALKANGLKAAPPKTKAGLGKATGYPDIKIETGKLPIYLEVKSYAATTADSSMRSFYLSPAEDPKVSDDGYHLLVGFEIERNGNLYTPVGFGLVDLYGLNCDMKAEFNSDNRRLYEKKRLLAKEKVPPNGRPA